MTKWWECDVCGEQFKRKRDLVEHLKEHFEEADETVSRVVEQLESIGVDNPYA